MERNKEKDQILVKVKEYYKKYHEVNNQENSSHRVPYAGRIYDEQEMVNLVSSALDFWLTSGEYSKEFESKLANYLGSQYCFLVNSGSSANLLAFMALTSPLLGERQINRGDEIITVAAGFPTTVSPIIQYGAIPVFLDVEIPGYNVDVSLLESALSPKTKAVMLAHTLGNPFNVSKIKDFCDRYNLWLIEDNCDSLGSKYWWNGSWRFTGTVGDIGTSSFYPPHHITMGEGGAVYTDNPLLSKIIKSMRDWGRDCECPSGIDNLCGHRFDKQYGDLPAGYDHKYVYSHWGYNLKATDMQAAIGCEQLNKLDEFISKRKKNHDLLYHLLEDEKDHLILPEATINTDPSWFGFLITCREQSARYKIIKNLEKNNIQTRMLFAGNITKHPCFLNMKNKEELYRIIGDLTNTNTIMNNSFWVGVYPGLSDTMLHKIASEIKVGINAKF